ncbi:MAG: phosphatase PAP2 family protein [Leucobacter sp.]
MSITVLRRLRVLWILLFWLIIGVGAYVLGVLSTTGQWVEENALSASHFNTDPPAPLSLVSTPTIALALVVLGLIALWAHGVMRALIVVLVPVGAIVASQLLKSEVLWRPDLMSLAAENSFPSGHMTVFASLVAATVFAVTRHLRAIVALAGAVLLSVVSWQLLTYGWHRPSDVLGALAIGAASFAAVTLITPLHPARGVWLVRTVSIGLSIIGWVTVGAALVLLFLAWRSENADLMLNAAQFGSIALCSLAAHSFMRLAILARSAKE